MITQQQSEAARDRGMELSEANANRAKARWSEDAEAAVLQFCKMRDGEGFLTEEVRAFAEEMDLVDTPKNQKAWGGVMRRCAANGIIQKVGYAPSLSSNLSPKVLWKGM